ncbi:50S ribosomal protein L13 [candidate division WS5 bacterium]|uniref:Large ribosomal subunit protein uL13 n=1 Tax=candidate division WS5 bacterium TaxID=2093353 RepID=A0A419DAA2_9BACT|nr:MAG: 50S ribosomal protein L13 [candidate division WS5 bacterium]
MKTFIPKKENIERRWYLIDAKGQTLGKLAVIASDILRGKNKPSFSPHMDLGDNLIIINASKVKVTGNKTEDKKYYSHSWYPGGLKTTTFKEMIEKKPDYVIRHAVLGMLPKNRLQKEFIKKLKVYADSKHGHEAQKPEEIRIEKGRAIQK